MAKLSLAHKIFAALWLAGIAALVTSGFAVDGYKLYVARIPLPHPYPLGGVLSTSLMLTFELGFVRAVLRPASYARSWWRALCAAVVTAIASLDSFLSLMHAPPCLATHCLVLMCLTVGLFGLFLASAVAALRSRLAQAQN
ncbi:MAG TPA: hypothetical protein VMI54_08360 [Polyangiaceae bacterium]|nr:hypothetical protein [Polyangiaceae bacterium]